MNSLLHGISIYAASLLMFLLLDYIYLGLYGAANSLYIPLHEKIQGKKVEVKIPSAIIAYLISALAIALFVVRVNIDKKEWVLPTIISGVLAGLVVYGTYNFTNYALFDDYSLRVVIQDTLWGMICFPLAGLGAIKLMKSV